MSIGDELVKMDSYHAINDVLDGVTLHDKQCVDVLKFLWSKRSIMIYDTGTGKTLLAAAIMKMLHRVAPGSFSIMIVTKDQLLQTPTKLKQFAGLRVLATYADSKVLQQGFIREDFNKYDVIMITEECLLNKQVMDRLYGERERIKCIVIDEAHKLNNFNSAHSAGMLKALVNRVEYVCALTATPIVTESAQIARLAFLLAPKKYPDPKRLARDLETGRFSIDEDPCFFINRKAAELGRDSTPNGYVIPVQPSVSQLKCHAGGVKLFQECKGYGAINQVNALIDLLKKQEGRQGLVYVSQMSIIDWVSRNLTQAGIKFAVINGDTATIVRKDVTERFAGGEFQVIVTSLTTALDLDCDFVVFYEFTVEIEQMIGRAHRGLNNKELDVYFIITEDTPEVTYFFENIVPRCELISKILGKPNNAVAEVARGLEANVKC